jgi:hypothetical protein
LQNARYESAVAVSITVVISDRFKTNGSGDGLLHDHLWDLDDDPNAKVVHIAEHDLTKEDVEEVLVDPEGRPTSRSSGLPIVFGMTSTGRLIAVVFQEIDSDTAKPVTAYDVEE